jgi:hypothetical protein
MSFGPSRGGQRRGLAPAGIVGLRIAANGDVM